MTTYLLREIRDRLDELTTNVDTRLRDINRKHSPTEPLQDALTDLRIDVHEAAGGIGDVIREHEQEQRIVDVVPAA